MDDQHPEREAVSWTVGQVAAAAGASVRALHHYDRIGLLRPAGRSAGGHRLYAAADVARLRRVLFYRELDLTLPEITRLLDDPDGADHLRRQHAMLRARLERTRALLTAVEDELAARHAGISLTPDQQLAIFGTDTFAAHLAQSAVPGPGRTGPAMPASTDRPISTTGSPAARRLAPKATGGRSRPKPTTPSRPSPPP